MKSHLNFQTHKYLISQGRISNVTRFINATFKGFGIQNFHIFFQRIMCRKKPHLVPYLIRIRVQWYQKQFTWKTLKLNFFILFFLNNQICGFKVRARVHNENSFGIPPIFTNSALCLQNWLCVCMKVQLTFLRLTSYY